MKAAHYKLIDERVVGEPDISQWALWHSRFVSEGKHRIRRDEFKLVDDVRTRRVFVSTIFTGVDMAPLHAPDDIALQHLLIRGVYVWETMTFGGPLCGWRVHWPSRDVAIAGHGLLGGLAFVTGAEAERRLAWWCERWHGLASFGHPDSVQAMMHGVPTPGELLAEEAKARP